MDRIRQMPRTWLLALTVIAIAFSLAFGYWVGQDDADVVGWLIATVVGALVAPGLLLRFVPATEAEFDGNAPARRGLVLGLVALVTLIVFWLGLPIAIGVPAVVVGAGGGARAAVHGQESEATAAIVLGAFAVIVGFILPISGA